MSEAEKIDRAERRKHAEARLSRSRSAREAAASAHAGRLLYQARLDGGVDAGATNPATAALTRLETKILDAANDVLLSKGEDGRAIADLLRGFVTAHSE